MPQQNSNANEIIHDEDMIDSSTIEHIKNSPEENTDQSKTTNSKEYINPRKPDFISKWADPDYLNTESYKRVTKEKAAAMARQTEAERLAEVDKGKGTGDWKVTGYAGGAGAGAGGAGSGDWNVTGHSGGIAGVGATGHEDVNW